MRKAGAFLTVAGLACAGVTLAVSWHDERTEEASVSAPSEVVNAPPRRSDLRLRLAPEGWRSESAAPRDAAAASPEPVSAPVIVTLARRNNEPVVTTPGLPAHHDRVTLVRELQRGLKRVGCYEGEINGVWTRQSRDAMRAFTVRLNAALPVEAPDDVLLALVQGQAEQTCSAACPTGEGLAEGGRCLPNALLAKKLPSAPVARVTVTGHSAPVTTVTGWESTTTVSADAAVAASPPALAAPPEGRMALAGPTQQTAAQPRFPAAPLQRYETSNRTHFGASFLRQLDRRGNN
jgi:hypothetical protein